jgi:hypothetical protein
LQANAGPIRILVITSNPEVPSNLRWGHAAGGVAPVVPMPFSHPIDESRRPHGRPHCAWMKLKEKAIDASNALRAALGLPLIETFPQANTEGGEFVRILPFPANPSDAAAEQSDEIHSAPEPHRHHHNGHVRHRYKHHRCHGSVLKRIHRALTSLGTWEGRIVAFVLGKLHLSPLRAPNIQQCRF